jgi:hypothetical protein
MGHFQPPLMGYPFYEVLSSLRKTIKLGDKEDAIYWANVIIEGYNGNAAKLVARQLWIMAAEDIDDPLIVIRAMAVYNMAGTAGETDHLFYLAAAMCDAMREQDGETQLSTEQMVIHLVAAMAEARKFWEHPDGRLIDDLWSKAIGDLKDRDRRKPIPEIALDQHTSRGKRMAKAGEFGEPGQMRDELSGTDVGRQKTIWQFLTTGKLDRDVRIPDGTPGLAELVERQNFLQGRRAKGYVTPKDALLDKPEDGLFPDPVQQPIAEDTATRLRKSGGAGSPTQICEF